MGKNRKMSLGEVLGLLGICLIPFLVLFFIFITAKASPEAYHFTISDETDYWIEAVTIVRRGLLSHNAGYFGYGYSNHSPILYFGGHGLFNLLPNIITAALLTQKQYLSLISNAGMISLGALIYYFLTKSLKKTLLVTVLLFLFVPFALYYFTGMIEVLLFSGIFLFIPLWQKLLSAEPGDNRVLNWYFLVVFVWSLFRITYIFFLIPAFLYELWRCHRSIWVLLLKYFAVFLAAAVLFWLTTASYPWYFITQWMRSDRKLDYFIRHALSVAYHIISPVGVAPVEVAFRWSYLLWLAFLIYLLIRNWKRKPKEQQINLLSHVLLLTGKIAFLCLLYEIEDLRSIRYLAVAQAFSMIYFLVNAERWPNRPTSAVAIAFVWLVIGTVFLYQREYYYTELVTRRLEPTNRSLIFQKIKYDPNAKSRWENTIYLDFYDDTEPDFNYYDPGLGIMFPQFNELDDALAAASPEEALRAKYYLTSEEIEIPTYTKVGQEGRLNFFQKSDTLPIGSN